MSGFENARISLRETVSEGQPGLTLGSLLSRESAEVSASGDLPAGTRLSGPSDWVDKNIQYIGGPITLFGGIKEAATYSDVHRLMRDAAWESPFSDPKWRSTVRKTLEQRTKVTAHLSHLEGVAAVEQKVINRIWMRGVAKGFVAAAAVVAGNELVDRTIFNGIRSGPFSHYADLASPALCLLPAPWPVRIAAMLGLHAGARYLEL